MRLLAYGHGNYQFNRALLTYCIGVVHILHFYLYLLILIIFLTITNSVEWYILWYFTDLQWDGCEGIKMHVFTMKWNRLEFHVFHVVFLGFLLYFTLDHFPFEWKTVYKIIKVVFFFMRPSLVSIYSSQSSDYKSYTKDDLYQ